MNSAPSQYRLRSRTVENPLFFLLMWPAGWISWARWNTAWRHCWGKTNYSTAPLPPCILETPNGNTGVPPVGRIPCLLSSTLPQQPYLLLPVSHRLLADFGVPPLSGSASVWLFHLDHPAALSMCSCWLVASASLPQKGHRQTAPKRSSLSQCHSTVLALWTPALWDYTTVVDPSYWEQSTLAGPTNNETNNINKPTHIKGPNNYQCQAQRKMASTTEIMHLNSCMTTKPVTTRHVRIHTGSDQ